MTRNVKLALGISAVTLTVLIAACVTVISLAPALPGALGCTESTAPVVSPVISNPDRIERLFPALAPIGYVRWQEREVRPRTCPDVGPMDYVIEGVLFVDKEFWFALKQRPDQREVDLPKPPIALIEFGVPAGVWFASAQADQELSNGTNTSFFWELNHEVMYFVHRTS